MKIIKLLSQQCWHQWWPCCVFMNQTFLTTAWRDLLAAKLSSFLVHEISKSADKDDIVPFSWIRFSRATIARRHLPLAPEIHAAVSNTERTFLCVCVRVCYLKQQVLCVFMECNMLTAVSNTERNSSVYFWSFWQFVYRHRIDVCANFSAPYTHLWGSIC